MNSECSFLYDLLDFLLFQVLGREKGLTVPGVMVSVPPAAVSQMYCLSLLCDDLDLHVP